MWTTRRVPRRSRQTLDENNRMTAGGASLNNSMARCTPMPMHAATAWQFGWLTLARTTTSLRAPEAVQTTTTASTEAERARFWCLILVRLRTQRRTHKTQMDPAPGTPPTNSVLANIESQGGVRERAIAESGAVLLAAIHAIPNHACKLQENGATRRR